MSEEKTYKLICMSLSGKINPYELNLLRFVGTCEYN